MSSNFSYIQNIHYYSDNIHRNNHLHMKRLINNFNMTNSYQNFHRYKLHIQHDKKDNFLKKDNNLDYRYRHKNFPRGYYYKINNHHHLVHHKPNNQSYIINNHLLIHKILLNIAINKFHLVNWQYMKYNYYILDHRKSNMMHDMEDNQFQIRNNQCHKYSHIFLLII